MLASVHPTDILLASDLAAGVVNQFCVLKLAETKTKAIEHCKTAPIPQERLRCGVISTMGQTNSSSVDTANIVLTVCIEPEATVQTTDSGMGRPVSGWFR